MLVENILNFMNSDLKINELKPVPCSKVEKLCFERKAQ